MKKTFFVSLAFISLLFIQAGASNADILKITASSDSLGELGWFAVDEDTLAVDRSLAASQFVDYFWSDPKSGVSIIPADIFADTGKTYFDFIGNEWTVTGADGFSLTAQSTELWIAGTQYLGFLNYGSYYDVTWTTGKYVSQVPEPAAMLLLGCGLAVLAGFRRREKTLNTFSA